MYFIFIAWSYDPGSTGEIRLHLATGGNDKAGADAGEDDRDLGRATAAIRIPRPRNETIHPSGLVKFYLQMLPIFQGKNREVLKLRIGVSENAYEAEPEAVNMTPSLEPAEKPPLPRNRRSVTILFGAVVALASFAYFSRYCSDALFSDDAADYVRAAKIGFFASYFETRSVGLWGSIRIMKQYPQARLHLWDFLEQQDDPAPSRHWHVAPGFYGDAIASQLGAASRTHRLIMAAAGAITVGTIFVGLRFASVDFLLAFATAALATLSPAVVSTSSTVSPHAPFLAALIASGFAFAQYLDKGGRARGIATGVTLGAAIATCELSITICVAFGLILVWRARRSGIRSTINLLPTPVVALLITLLLLWPGGVLRGGYVLSYGMWCLSVLLRRSKNWGSWGEASTRDILMSGAQGSPVVLLLFVVIAIGVFLVHLSRKSNLHIQVFSWLVLGFFIQGILNRFHNPTYASHFVVLTWVLLALLCQQWVMLATGKARFPVFVAVCSMYLLLAIPTSGWPAASARAIEDEQRHSARAQKVIALANKMIPRGATILGNYDHEIWHLYLPQNVIQHSTSASNLQPRPWLRMPEEYWIIADPVWLSSDWRGRLPDLSPSDSAGGFVLGYFGPPRNR